MPLWVKISRSSECRKPAVDDVGLLDPRFQAGQASLDLGNHPLVDHAPGDQLVAFSWVSDPGSGCSGSFLSARMPGVSVRKTSFSA